MRRRCRVLTLLAVLWLATVPRPAAAQTSDPLSISAKAWILVDADSGRVLDGFNHREPLPPASTTKLMTALVALERLPADTVFTVGPTAAVQPAMRIGLQVGQRWALDPALHSLLMVSANDVAYALAEVASGSLAAFAADMNDTAARYGMQDSTFNDPAGFDDAASFNGGSRVSARDLAIAARNALAVPKLAGIIALPEYRFTGPAREHHLTNHNKLLRRYPDAIGMKTGFTRRAGHTFVGAATREGRTMIVVLLNTTDTYGAAATLLDRGFATPPGTRGTGEQLPAPRVRLFQPKPAPTASGEHLEAAGALRAAEGGSWPRRATFLVSAAAGTVVVMRRREVERRRLRAERRRRLAEARRQEMARIAQPDDWDVPARAELGTSPLRQLTLD